MRKNILQFIKYALLLSLVAYMLAVFIPGSYEVPQMHKREGSQYWDLQTGSKIAYTLVSAKGQKKPFPIIYLHGGAQRWWDMNLQEQLAVLRSPKRKMLRGFDFAELAEKKVKSSRKPDNLRVSSD